MPPLVLSVEQAQDAGIGAELDPEVLEDTIEEEEAWLARRIGPLVGERTQVFQLAGLSPTSPELRLQRPTDIVELVMGDADISATVQLRADGYTVARLPEGTAYLGLPTTVSVTYTPTDELEVRRALKELVSLTLGMQNSGGLQAEIMGSYSYTRAAGSATRRRRSIVRELLGPKGASSIRLLSSVQHGTAGALSR